MRRAPAARQETSAEITRRGPMSCGPGRHRSTTPAAPYSSGTQATPLPDASTPRRSDGEDAVKRSVSRPRRGREAHLAGLNATATWNSWLLTKYLQTTTAALAKAETMWLIASLKASARVLRTDHKIMIAREKMAGPLDSLRVVEMAAIGPVPMASTLLADMGADIVRIVRAEAIDLGLPGRIEPRFDILARGRPTLAVDLKSEAGRNTVLDLARNADALLEGFRPGVMERLGLGPDACLGLNPRLVYVRMTGS